MTEEEIGKENERYFMEGGHISPPLQWENLVGSGEVKALIKPEKGSHKGMNGKLLIIGGSELFHGASLWALKAASRIVDMVFYASVPENLEIARQMKMEVLDYIAIPREQVKDYISEADCVLIGPGMVRIDSAKCNPSTSLRTSVQSAKPQFKIQNLNDINKMTDEGEQTYAITEYLLKKYPKKQWVIDAGSLQVMEPEWIPKGAILTPHRREFEKLVQSSKLKVDDLVRHFAYEHHCVVILKGEKDIITDGERIKYAVGGNPGMTKGGTGDVLAGVVAGFACKNESFLAARAGSFLNKLAGEMLYKKVKTMFNASDLCEMIPEAYKWCLEY